MTVVQGQFENTVTKVEEEKVQMPSQITIELECAVQSCNFDRHGTKYKTPPLPQQYALQLMEMHRACAHGLGGVEIVNDRGAQVEYLPEPVCKAVLHRGCSVEEFKSFNVDWDKYAVQGAAWGGGRVYA